MSFTETASLTEFLLLRIAEDEAAARAASAGPWFYNGYSAISSAPMCAVDEAFWTDERTMDGHTYEHRLGQICPACGERPAYYGETAKPEVRGQRFGTYWDCAFWDEAYEADGNVAHVPAHHGDTAIGRRIADATHIASHDPTRVLAECEAKRRILVRIQMSQMLPVQISDHAADALRRDLALSYSGHPDYLPEWKP